ncbi:ABC transporter ATP-binding protein [Candidatus Roseilinea sp. NK_OTU-006]|uniref:ABC transporter ATP-binding protein n=1 Tax=Candidatus Roseilinea sp. NK_OTU-006 TaxID=2704250 RepID=UPI00403DB229
MATALMNDTKTPAMDRNGALIRTVNVFKNFELPDGNGIFTVLENINLTVKPGEIVALLGRSGSGKSTLLRILAGLIPASSGDVFSSGRRVTGPNPDVTMVFQSFALLPWLTVQQNVELGLEALGVPLKERQARALKAIDMVGLDGFESAYPKELSGGMRQRVGFARAFVKQPKVLFMDEPFSALDVLTAENLRGEISDLWEKGDFPAQSVLIVTHNIEEAVYLADRVIILGANPGRVRGEVTIDLPRPRDRSARRFKELVDGIYIAMTNPDRDVTAAMAGVLPRRETPYPPLPHATVGGISGLLELLNERPELRDLPEISSTLQLATDDLLPIVDAAVMLGLAEVRQGDITLTDNGRAFATADIQTSKDIFRAQLLERVPMVKMIYNTLQAKPNGSMRAGFFLDILDEHFPREEAQHQFETAVDWGRYAELFEYDRGEDRLLLPVEASELTD